MPAAMQGEMLPNIYRFKLGGFEVATIMDSHVIRPGLTPSFGGEAHADVDRLRGARGDLRRGDRRRRDVATAAHPRRPTDRRRSR